MNPAFQLYVDAQFISPYAMSAFVALTEKGLPFETLTIDLAQRQNLAAGYSSVSLTRRVPTLVEEGFSLSESSAIAEYLEDRFPAPAHLALYPSDPKMKARAREIQAWLRSDLMPIRQERPTEVVYYGDRFVPLSAKAQVAADKLVAAVVPLLGEQESLFGAWSIVDVDLAVMLNRLALHGDPLPDVLVRYAKRQWERPSVQQWLRQVQAQRSGAL